MSTSVRANLTIIAPFACALLIAALAAILHTHPPMPATVQPTTHSVTTTAALPDGLVPCAHEDGSGPGQAFPCRWDAAVRGNGQGASYTMWGPDSYDYS